MIITHELHGVVVFKVSTGTCGHKVARFVICPAPKKKPKATSCPSLFTTIFDVWLYGDENCTEEDHPQDPDTNPKTLYNFAKVITQAFGFQFDHCFGLIVEGYQKL